MENTVVSAKEAQTLLAAIKILLKTPLQGAPPSPASLLTRHLGMAGRPMAPDQWYLLSIGALRALLLEGTDARKQAEKLAAVCAPGDSPDGESDESTTVDREAVRENAPAIRDLLREAASNAEFFASQSTPEDLELKIKERVNYHLWRSAPVRVVIVLALFAAGAVGVTSLEGLHTRLTATADEMAEDLNVRFEELDALAARATALATEAQDTLRTVKTQMAQVQNDTETFRVQLHTSATAAQSEITRSQNEITNTISQSNERIATLYMNITQRLEGLEEKTTNKFIQALDEKTSVLNQKLAALDSQADKLGIDSETTASRLGAAMNATDTLTRQLGVATSAVDKVGSAAGRIEGQVAGIEMQATAIAGRLAGLGESAQKDLDSIQQNATQARTLVGEADRQLAAIMNTRQQVETAEIDFSRNLADLRADIETALVAVDALETNTGDLAARAAKSDAAQRDAAQRMGSLTAQLSLMENSVGLLDGRRKAMDASLASLESDTATQRGILAATGTVVEQMQVDSADRGRTLGAIKAGLNADHVRLGEISVSIDQLRAKLNSLNAVHAALQPAFEGTLGSLQQAMAAYREAIGDYQPLVEQIIETRKQIDFLLAESDSDRIEIGELAKKLTSDWMTLEASVATTATEVQTKIKAIYDEKLKSIENNQN